MPKLIIHNCFPAEISAGISARNGDIGDVFASFSKAIMAEQVHGTDIVWVKSGKEEIVADAMLTHSREITLIVKTADCLPILLFDRETKTIGTIHAGRIGTQAQILSKVLAVLKKSGSSLSEVLLHFGPAIGVSHYEIAENTHFDLLQENLKQSISAGVSRDNVVLSGYCTVDNNDLFYSYRKNNKTHKRCYSYIRFG